MVMAMATGEVTTSPTTETKEASEATDIMSTTDTMGEGFIMAADISTEDTMGGITDTTEVADFISSFTSILLNHDFYIDFFKLKWIVRNG
jgi:hypothetical protein